MANSVQVFGKSGEKLSNTTNAKARVLLDSGKAFVRSKDPFTIQLKKEDQMATTTSTVSTSVASTSPTTKRRGSNIYDYFKNSEHIYIRNVSKNNIQFPVFTGPGTVQTILIPRASRPFCFSLFVDKEWLTKSPAFSKFLNKKPTQLQLLSEDEYYAYHESLANAKGTELEDELSESDSFGSRVTSFDKSLLDADFTYAAESDAEVLHTEKITPRVISLLKSVEPTLSDDRKMSETKFLEELALLDGTLTRDDLESIAGKGFYKAVRLWATSRLDKMIGR
jgi:hypothetical protein